MENVTLAPGVEVSAARAGDLERAIAALLHEMWPTPAAGLLAPDLVLDFAAQYIRNTRAQDARWSPDDLLAEYLRQMTGEHWATVRRVAGAPRRGSPAALRLFLALIDAAARHRARPPLSTRRQMMVVLGAYLRASLRLGQASVYPITVPCRHRELRRWPSGPGDAESERLEREVLARHVENGGLRRAPDLACGWRLALAALAIARRGAVAIARGRGERRITLGCREQALEMVEARLLSEGQLWAILSKEGLVRDTAERFLARRAAPPTLLGL